LHGDVSAVLQKADTLEAAGINIPRVTTLGRRLREQNRYQGELPPNLEQARVMMEATLRVARSYVATPHFK